MAGRKHLIAVNRTVVAAGLDDRGPHAAVVDMARNLARRLDAVGSDDAPLGLVKAYQSAVKDLQRAAVRETAPKVGRDAGEMGSAPAPVDELEEFMRRWRVRPQDRGEPSERLSR